MTRLRVLTNTRHHVRNIVGHSVGKPWAASWVFLVLHEGIWN